MNIWLQENTSLEVSPIGRDWLADKCLTGWLAGWLASWLAGRVSPIGKVALADRWLPLLSRKLTA